MPWCDEFVLLLNSCSQQQTETKIAKFAQALAEYNLQRAGKYDVAFSYGIVEFDHEKHRTIDQLLAEADTLMYKLKNLNR